MSSGYQEPVGGTSSPSTGTAVGSKPIRAWLKVLRNVDIVAEPDYGSNFIPKIKSPIEILSTSLRLHNPAQTFYTNVESAALLANQSIKIPIITATESGNKKDEVVLLKQSQALENKTFPTYVDVTETAAPANPVAGKLRIYANTTTHELTQRDSTGAEKKMSDGTGGGGGGAPTDVSYVTLATNSTLTNERVLTASTRVTVTDGGVNSPVTLDVGSGSIVDAYIGTHTSTKITITAKGQLNSAIAYTDQANTMGDFDTTFRSSRLVLRDSDNTHGYFFAGSNLAANRTVTLPLLTGDDTLAMQAFAQALTNKTINASSNTISNIGDTEHAAHTSTKITITAKGQLNSSIAYQDQANSFGDFNQVFKDNRLLINNPADTFAYTIVGAAIAANRNLTLPLLTGNDTAVTEAFNQTLTNKTMSGASNTFSNLGDSAIAAHTSTKITITAKGQLNSAILYSDVDNALGSHYVDVTERAAPANPGAGVLRIYANSTTHELTQRDSSGTEKKFSDGSGGGGAPTTSQYLTLASDATLTSERILTASARVTLTDAGANSTATLDIGTGSIVDAYIGTHTSTKISITAKGQLNSAILYSDVDNVLGDHYLDLGDITTPSNPAAGTVRLFNNTTTGELSVRKSGGTTVSLETGGGGGGDPFTREEFDYYIYQVSTTQYDVVNGTTGDVDFTGGDFGALVNSCINAIQPSTNPDVIDKAGSIFFGPSTFEPWNLATTIIMKNRITLQGSGQQVSVVECASAANIDGIRTLNFSSQTTQNPSNTKGIASVVLRDFSLVGTDWLQTTGGCGIKKYGFAWTIENVEISHWKQQGIYTEWGTGGDSYSVFDVHNHAEVYNNVTLFRNKAGGILHRGPHDAYAHHCMFVGNAVYGLKTEHLNNTYTGDIHLSNCHVWDVDGDRGIWVAGGPVQFNELYVETVNEQAAGSIGIHAETNAIRGSYLWVFGCETGVLLEDGAPCTLDNVYLERNTYGLKVEGDGHRVTGYSINNNNAANNAGKNLILGRSGLAVGGNYINLTMWGAKTAQWENAAANVDNYLVFNVQAGTGETALLNTVALNTTSNVCQFLESGVGTLSGIGKPIDATSTQTMTNKTQVLSSNTVTDTSAASGDVPVYNGTKFVRSGATSPVSNTINLNFNQQLKMRGNDGNAFTYLQTHSLGSPNQALDWFKDYNRQTTPTTATIVAFTYGHNSDVSLYEFWSKWSGTNKRYFALDPGNDLIFMKAATVYLGASELVGLRDTGLTDDHIYTFPDAPGELAVRNVNINDGAISSHTSTKITITAKGQLNSAILYNDADNALGSHYFAITEIAQPANPAAGTLRVWADSTTHELSQVDSAGTVKKFSDGSGGGGGNLDSLSDVVISSPSTGQVVKYNGTNWINDTDATGGGGAALDDITDVTITTIAANQAIVRNSGNTAYINALIADANIGSHTSTKVTITTKGQLNSAIVYNDQTNAFGDFAQTFKDNQLKINNPADTFAYTIIAAAIGANRNLTLPLLAGNDTAVAEAFSQTLTNKTIDFASNTGTNVGDSAIAAHTSTKVTITAKGQLNSSIAYVDQANVFSDNDQSFRSARLRVANPANTFFYNFTAAAIAANRIINLPLLTATDTMAVLDFAQTFTNKTIVAGSNTITGIVDANIGSHTSTKVTITAKGQLNSAIVYNDQANTFGANNQTIPIANLLLSNNGNTGAFGVQASLTGTRVWSMPNASTNIMGHDTTDTMTNKTYNATGTGNALSNVGDTHIASHTSTKITITTKGQLNSAIVYNDAANTMGDFDTSYRSSRLILRDSDNTNSYIFAGGNLAANRTITYPVLSGNDVPVFEAQSQTMTSKTLTTPTMSTPSLTGLKLARATKTASTYTLTATDNIILADCTSNNITLSLPAVSGTDGQIYHIQKIDSTANTLTLDPNASETINGATTLVLSAQYQGVIVWSNNSAWYTLPNVNEKAAKATGNGTGAQTLFNIPHGMGTTPTYAYISVAQSGSAFIGCQYTVDGTNIAVTFASAPASGTGNVIIYWRAIL